MNVFYPEIQLDFGVYFFFEQKDFVTPRVVEYYILNIFWEHLLKMELLIVYSLLGLATILMFYRGQRALMPRQVADKETQTESPRRGASPVYDSPMSLSSDSLNFPFDFEEDYYGDGE